MYTDEELIFKLKNCDQYAFDLLFYKYYTLLLGNALLIVEDENAAKDIIQNFFVDFWQKKVYENLEGDIKGYLFRSVYNSSLNYVRQKKNYRKHISHYQKSNPTVIYQKELSLLQTELSPIISELPQQQKRAFTLVYFLQLKYEEAAIEMGVSINTVKSHLKATLALLRKHKNNFR